jgi:hypothetical protein
MPFKDPAKQKEAQQKHYSLNKDKYLQRIKTRRNKTKRWLIDYKQTLSCACGETHPKCLDFHHRDPSTKIDTVGSMVRNATIEALKEEIAKCDVLCSNCHRKLHGEGHDYSN